MNTQDNFSVALVHELCPICCTEMNHQIVLPKTLSNEVKTQIDEMNHKAVGFSKELCETCLKRHSEGFLGLIEIDPEQSDMKRLETIYRTGSMAWLKEDAAKQIFTDMDYFIEGKFAFLDQESFQHITSLAQKD